MIISTYRTRCQFSKKIINPGNIILQFHKKQYEYFIKTIYEIFYPFLSNEIIDIIIDKTNYKKYINHWGLFLYVNWIENYNNILNINNYKYKYYYCNSHIDSHIDSDIDSDT